MLSNNIPVTVSFLASFILHLELNAASALRALSMEDTRDSSWAAEGSPIDSHDSEGMPRNLYTLFMLI
jgi:hypothetical protein